jgi:hypothetical protein
VLLVVVVAVSLAASSQAAATPVCPKLTPAQLKGALGVNPASVSTGGSTGNQKGVPFLTCFYTLNGEASVTLKVYRGTAALELVEGTINVSIGTNNSQANATGVPCEPAKDGQCKGTLFNGHSVAAFGLGDRAYDFPGGAAGGANALFTWKGYTFLVQSSGPYSIPGPDLAQVLAFAHLLIKTGYNPV